MSEKKFSKFDRKFDYVIIKNTYQRVKTKLFGTANNDAVTLINLLEAPQIQKFLKYDKLLSLEGNLKGIIFATEAMMDLYSHFKDMIILDPTFGFNRFSMPGLKL